MEGVEVLVSTLLGATTVAAHLVVHWSQTDVLALVSYTLRGMLSYFAF